MTAQTLRQAAALMRERAEAATPGPWEAVEGAYGDPTNGPDHMRVVSPGWGTAYDVDHTLVRLEHEQHADAAHIASWHPAVALAVADWLDDLAADECFEEMSADNACACHCAALAVATAFLGAEVPAS